MFYLFKGLLIKYSFIITLPIFFFISLSTVNLIHFFYAIIFLILGHYHSKINLLYNYKNKD